MRYVLDTNIVAASFNGHPGVFGRLNRTLRRDRIFLPAMALAELRFGAFNSRRISENLARIDQALSVLTLAPVNRPIADRFGAIKADLRRRGITKSDADLLIAATALEIGATLVTNDGDLQDGAINALKVEDWMAPLS